MVLCISNITWTSSGVDEHGQPNDSIPDVEVTDGWYRMRLEVDEPLVRALRKGRLSVGRKIAIVGARVSIFIISPDKTTHNVLLVRSYLQEGKTPQRSSKQETHSPYASPVIHHTSLHGTPNSASKETRSSLH